MSHSSKSLPPCPFPKIFPSQLDRSHSFFMKLAYNQAIDAWNDNEVPIGAIIEYDGQIIASAHNQVESTRDPTAHAEILAITQASHALNDWRLNATTLYVTKEPCPMCSGAMVMSRIGRVLYALPDPKMGGLGGAFDLNAVSALNHHPVVQSGVMEKECRELLQAFFKIRRQTE